MKENLHAIIQRTKYPRALRTVINLSPVDTHINFGEGVCVERGCKLQGNITLKDNVRISSGARIEGDVSISRWTNIEPDVEIFGQVTIGSFCAIARKNTFQEINHIMSKPGIQMRFYDKVLNLNLEHISKGDIMVGNDVWIGTDCKILSGVTIGHGAVIAAGSIVTDDVEPYSVVAGVPAEHKKYRFSEEIRERLLDIEWWSWDLQKLKENRDFFRSEVKHSSLDKLE